MTYRPLPDYLTIKESKIDGLGLFATRNLPERFNMGISHVRDERFCNEYIRTPLGGFINHSEDPNCIADPGGDLIFLITTKEIKAGEELTVKYWLYEIK